jgi:hypothetical protein
LKYGIFLSRSVLEVRQGSDTVIISKPCGGPRQLWDFHEDGTIRSNTGNVLDIFEGRTQPETPVIVHPKHGSWNQIFRVVQVSG